VSRGLLKVTRSEISIIYTAVWDHRITAVLPLSDDVMSRLRPLLFGWWSGRLLGRLLRHSLSRKHGSTWKDRLASVRSRAASSSQQQGENKESGKQRKGSMYEELSRDAEAGRRALNQVLLAGNWWDWSHGSSLLFWRWDESTQLNAALDGMDIFVQAPLPTKMRAARRPTPDKEAQLGPKVDTVRLRNYILAGQVLNLTDLFDVPKGDTNIRVVYNGTLSGLNEVLQAPGFLLPNSDMAARLLMFYGRHRSRRNVLELLNGSGYPTSCWSRTYWAERTSNQASSKGSHSRAV
jgi:hypothetical protein